ncbi:fatty acid desaturase [Aeromonas sp. AE23HZ002T15]
MERPPIIMTNTLLFALSGLTALIAVPWYGLTHGYDLWQWLSFLLLFCYCGISITAGYHRLWSHKAYKAHPILQWIFAIGGALALQNSALHWSSDHRRHHRHVDDNQQDPYSAGRGFWYSHIGWMLREYQGERYHDYGNVRDLQNNPIVAFQHRYYLALTLATNLGVPLLLGLIHGDLLGMLLLAGVLRMVMTHHTTFFINSLAHIWGSQPFTDRNSARDNGILAFFTFGEGYHNFHHLFENDYRNGIRWWQFDPTKWLIQGAAWCGLARDLRSCPEERIEQARLQMQLKRAQARLHKQDDRELWQALLQEEYDKLSQQIQHYYASRKHLLEQRKRKALARYDRLKLQLEYRTLRDGFIASKRNWSRLLAGIA